MDVETLLQQGWQAQQQGDAAQAEQVYRQALKQDAGNARAWCYLGMALYDQRRWQESLVAYQRSLKIKPAFPIALNNMGNSFRSLGRIDEALKCFDAALSLDPKYLTAVRNKATALFWAGRLEEADRFFREAAQLDPHDPETKKNLGVIALLEGRYADGWPHYEARLDVAGVMPKIALPPRWNGEDLEGKRLVLLGEQGLGDTIQFVRYAAQLKEKYAVHITLACQRALLPLMSQYPHLDACTEMSDCEDAADYCVPLVSLPGILAQDETSFPKQVPYLAADQLLSQKWERVLASYPRPRVGIAWQGNPKFPGDFLRSVPLGEFAPLGQLHGLTLISVQQRDGLDQLAEQSRRWTIHTLGEHVDRQGAFMDTAAILPQLDLLITSDSAVAHLAGGLAVPTWLLLPLVPDWRWQLRGEQTVWYPSMRLFRQIEMRDWQTPMNQVVEALQDQFPDVRLRQPQEYCVSHSGAAVQVLKTRHGLMSVLTDDKHLPSRSLRMYGEFATAELGLLKQMTQAGQSVLEAFAGIGAHSVPLAQHLGSKGRLCAVEPDPLQFRLLTANQVTNQLSQVDCIADPLAVDVKDFQIIKLTAGAQTLTLLNAWRDQLEATHPLLYVANDDRNQSPRIIRLLSELDYTLYWWLPRLFSGDNYYANEENPFGNSALVRLLGIPPQSSIKIEGLPQVGEDWPPQLQVAGTANA